MSHELRAEVSRVELDELGVKHFLEVRATVRRMLEALPGPARAAFAASAAQRAVRHTHGNEATLEKIWRALDGDRDAAGAVATAVAEFYLSPAWRERSHDDPANMVDHAKMAVLYAAECFLHGSLDFAMWAGWRGFDVTTCLAAADADWPHRRPAGVTAYAWELAHPVIQLELEQQLESIEMLSVAESEARAQAG